MREMCCLLVLILVILLFIGTYSSSLYTDYWYLSTQFSSHLTAWLGRCPCTQYTNRYGWISFSNTSAVVKDL